MDIPQLRQKYEDITLDTLIDIVDEVVVRKGGQRSKPLDPSPKVVPAPTQTDVLATIPCWGRTSAGAPAGAHAGDRCPNPRVPETDWCPEHAKHIAGSAAPGKHAAQSEPRQPRRASRHARDEQTGSFVEQTDFFETHAAARLARHPSPPLPQGRVARGARGPGGEGARHQPVPDGEPAPIGPAPTGLASKPTSPVCYGITKSGAACRTPPRKQSVFCFNHDPAFAAQQRRNVSAAGRASGASRRGIPEMTNSDFVNLIDRSGVQAAIDAMFRLELFGKIPAARSRVFVRLLSLAVRNFDRAQSTTPDGQLADPPRAAHDEQVFTNSRLGFNDYSAGVVSALQNAELSRRVQEIEDIGARRQEYLKTNDMWAPTEPLNQASRAYLTPFYGA